MKNTTIYCLAFFFTAIIFISLYFQPFVREGLISNLLPDNIRSNIPSGKGGLSSETVLYYLVTLNNYLEKIKNFQITKINVVGIDDNNKKSNTDNMPDPDLLINGKKVGTINETIKQYKQLLNELERNIKYTIVGVKSIDIYIES